MTLITLHFFIAKMFVSFLSPIVCLTEISLCEFCVISWSLSSHENGKSFILFYHRKYFWYIINVRHYVGFLNSFSIKNIFCDKMDWNFFYFRVTILFYIKVLNPPEIISWASLVLILSNCKRSFILTSWSYMQGTINSRSICLIPLLIITFRF